MFRKDAWVAAIGQAFLILAAALVAWACGKPLIFASLGPTAFEQIETPERPSAHPYNVVIGHLIAVLAGFISLAILGAWSAPPVSAHGVPLPRVWAAVLATVLTVLGTQFARATQPAALSTTLLISLGIMQTRQDGFIIMAGVLLMAFVGEPIRRWRVKSKQASEAVSDSAEPSWEKRKQA